MARILIVDDDELLAEVMTEWLEAAGHMVSAVHHGDEALRAVADSVPDLLILDYSLPGLSGLSILQRVRAQPRAAGMPIMMLTAKSGKLLLARAHAAGADEYLSKPVEPGVLLERVEALLVGGMIARRAASRAP
jgi:DNA-binding response OmpR family regulator